MPDVFFALEDLERMKRFLGQQASRICNRDLGNVDVINIDRRKLYLSRYTQANPPQPSCFNFTVHFSYVYLFSYAYGLVESQVVRL